MSFKNSFWLTIVLLMMAMILGQSVASKSDPLERVQALTRPIEFDYVSWTLDAFGLKFGQIALDASGYLPAGAGSATVLEELGLIQQINQAEAQLNDIYADPRISDPQGASAELRSHISALRSQRVALEPLAEAVLQDQISAIADQSGLTFLGQALPPVLYHTTPPPDALVISPRDIIRQDQNISISPDITADQMDLLENQVDQAMNVSSLVVGIGGIGLYPTMVMETTDINGLTEVVAHEWVHNYLTLHPLGFSYTNSAELRIMNETVAAIAGKELSRLLVEKYYPQLLPPQPVAAASNPPSSQSSGPPPFDFRAEMHLTRLAVDQLLTEGKIDQAESYMDQRRVVFWDQGYHIRKLNQAYFAFYGAYADQPGGEAGADPVGTAVRLLRARSSSLADFINRIAWMWNFEQLKKAVGGG